MITHMEAKERAHVLFCDALPVLFEAGLLPESETHISLAMLETGKLECSSRLSLPWQWDYNLVIFCLCLPQWWDYKHL